jgi:mono/diheme cytochrome c family protein
MPHLGVSSKEAKLITRYLLTLPEPAGGFLISAHQSVDPHRQIEANTISQIKPKNQTLQEREKSIQAGRDLFLSHSCAVCHTVVGTGGKFGPRLDGVAMRRTDAYLEDILSNGTANAAMQAQSAKLSAEEVLHLVDFLKSLPKPDEPPAIKLK